jgi:hypothetical protein
MSDNPNKPRSRREVDCLPTHDGRELLGIMIATVGLQETARRIARHPSTVRRWLTGRDPVPEVVRQWLLAAATNSRKTGSLDGLKWHYPRPRPIARQRRRAFAVAVREILAAEDEREWEEMLAEPLDPYA